MKTILTTTGISLLSNTARELKKPLASIADKISSSIDEEKHHYPKGTLAFAKKLAQLDAVEEIIGGFFEPTILRRVKKIDDDGSIRVLWADNEKANNMTIRTTARGLAQTMRFCDRHIRPLLNS